MGSNPVDNTRGVGREVDGTGLENRRGGQSVPASSNLAHPAIIARAPLRAYTGAREVPGIVFYFTHDNHNRRRRL